MKQYTYYKKHRYIHITKMAVQKIAALVQPISSLFLFIYVDLTMTEPKLFVVYIKTRKHGRLTSK